MAPGLCRRLYRLAARSRLPYAGRPMADWRHRLRHRILHGCTNHFVRVFRRYMRRDQALYRRPLLFHALHAP